MQTGVQMIITLPGITNSGPEHWQTRWEAQDSRLVRFSPSDWDHPDLEDWKRALRRAVSAAERPPVLVAHSLACLLVAHWVASQHQLPVSGAFMVSVPDATTAVFPPEARGFSNPPALRFPFPAVILASSNDPFGSFEHAEARAAEWGAGLIRLGHLGHINAASGLGEWEEGRRLLDCFLAGLRF